MAYYIEEVSETAVSLRKAQRVGGGLAEAAFA
jgi:hypothetical protein